MTDIWNLDAICRCCHRDGYFRSMEYPYVGKDGDVEVYGSWLKEVFGINMETPTVKASVMICEDCIATLRDAKSFKQQVTNCELRFRQYCQNEATVKVEPGVISETGVRLLHGFDFIDSDAPKHEDIKIKLEIDHKSDICEDMNHFDNCDGFDNDSDSEPLARKDRHETKDKEKKSVKNVKKKVTKTIKKRIVSKSQSGKVGKKNATQSVEKRKTIKDIETPKKEKRGTKEQSPKKPRKNKREEALKESLHRCKQCGLYMRNKRELNLHCATEHKGEENIQSKEIRCQFCDVTVCGITKYKTHVNRTHPDKGTVCNYCPEVFVYRQLLLKHYQTCHNISDKYECDICHKVFLSKSIIREHMNRHLGTRRATCQICGHQFNGPNNLKYHIIQVHQNIRAFKCQYCPKNYKTKRALTFHTRTNHTFEKPFKCDQCEESFVGGPELNAHTANAHTANAHIANAHNVVQKKRERNIFRCYICKEVIRGRKSYRLHLNKEHSGMLPYQCHICPKSFSNKYVLNRHILSHDDTQKIECEICLKLFKHKMFLTAHYKRTHNLKNRDGTPRVSKEDYVKCDICNRMVQHLEAHKAAVHSKTRFKCHLCERDYSMNSALQRHIKETHLKLYMASCDICNVKFLKARSVMRHKIKKHPEVFQKVSEKEVKIETDVGEKEQESSDFI